MRMGYQANAAVIKVRDVVQSRLPLLFPKLIAEECLLVARNLRHLDPVQKVVWDLGQGLAKDQKKHSQVVSLER